MSGRDLLQPRGSSGGPTPGTDPAVARTALLVLAGTALGAAAALGVRIVAARALTPADLGIFTLGVAIVTALGGVAGLGMNAAAAQRLAPFVAAGDDAGRAAARAGARTGVARVTAVASAAALVLALAAPAVARAFDQAALAWPLALLAPVVLALAVGNAMVGVGRAWGDVAGRVAMRDGGGGLLRLTAVFVAVVAAGGRPTASTVALAFAAGCCAGEAALFVYGWRLRWLAHAAADASSTALAAGRAALGRDLGPFFALAALAQVAAAFDVLLLGRLAAASVVGVYGVARGIAKVLEIGSEVAGYRFLPVAAARAATGGAAAVAPLYVANRRFAFCLVWPAAAVALAAPGPLLELFFGSRFAAGAGALRILVAGLLVSVACGYTDKALVAVGGAARVSRGVAAGVAAGALVALAAIPRLGAAGAALGWTVMLVVQNAILLDAVRRRVGRGVVAAGLLPLLARTALPTAAAAAVLVAAGADGLALAAGVGLAAAALAWRAWHRDA